MTAPSCSISTEVYKIGVKIAELSDTGEDGSNAKEAQTQLANQCKIIAGEFTMTRYIYILIKLVCMFSLLTAIPSMANDNQIEGARGCVATRALTSTEVVDDQIVLFYMRGKTVYVNVLPEQCKGLSRYGRFKYTTLSGSLCHFDTIRVLIGGGYPGRTCRLGSFYLIDREDIPAIIESRYRPAASGPLAPADVEEIFSETEDLKNE